MHHHLEMDLYRNELVFKRVNKPAEFAKVLRRGKDLKFRKYGNTFYVSLEFFDIARQVLRDHAKYMRVSMRYEKFAHLFVVNKEDIVIEWGPAECTIKGKGMPWNKVIPQTRYFDKAAFNSKSYEKGQWDGHVHLFDAVDGKFPSGLLERITRILSEENVPFTINRTFAYPAPQFMLNPVFDFTPTDDQRKAVAALDKANNGIAKLPTGFGKTSFVAAQLIANKGVRSMFLANQRVLISDAKRDFQSVFRNDNVRIGTIGDGEFDPGDITVASIQGVVAALEPPSKQEVVQVTSELARAKNSLSLAQMSDEKKKWEDKAKKMERKLERITFKTERAAKIIQFLKTVDLFIVDEAQVLGTNMWNRFLRVCPAPYRYTLSATPTRGDGGAIQIVAATGEIRYESSAAEQIEKGRLAEFKGNFVRFDHGIPREMAQELRIDYHQAYRLFIMNNHKRNEHLCEQVIRYAKDNKSVLALVTRLEHAEIVQRMLIDMGMPEWTMAIVTGDTPKKVREERIERYRAGEFPILIGSSIFDVGFNAKNASRMVRFNAGGSEVREPQRAGRTVRKREDDSHGETYDVLDVNVPFFEFQSWKRIKLLKEEFGAGRVKILPRTIKGELDIAALRDVVAEIPEETDRKKGEEIIQRMLGVDPNELPDVEGIDDLEQDADLKSILEELKNDIM